MPGSSSPRAPGIRSSRKFLETEFPKRSSRKIRFGTVPQPSPSGNRWGDRYVDCSVRVGVGLKPISWSGSVRLIHSAISYAIKFGRKSVTLVHKGEHHEVHLGRLPGTGVTSARSSISGTRSTPGRSGRAKGKGEDAANAEQKAALAAAGS